MTDLSVIDRERMAIRQVKFVADTRKELGRMEASILAIHRTTPFCTYCWSRDGEWLGPEPAEPEVFIGASGPGWRCEWCGNFDEVTT